MIIVDTNQSFGIETICENTFIMPIIAKMSALITSVGTFICTFSSVPSTKCNVYLVSFVLFRFFLFITPTTPICNQKDLKKQKPSQKFLKMVGGAIVSACFCLLSTLHFVVTCAFIGLCRTFAPLSTFC